MNEINKVVFYVHTGMFAHGFDDFEHETSVFIRVVSRASLEHLEEEGAEHGVADEREDEHDVRKKRPHAFHRCPSGHRARAPLFHRHLLALSVSVLYMLCVTASRRLTCGGLPDRLNTLTPTRVRKSVIPKSFAIQQTECAASGRRQARVHSRQLFF